MRRSFVLVFAVTVFSSISAQAQVGVPGIEYANTVAGGEGVQLYPYDQQDPWIHGYFQRYPAYGGFASFRPYNYRHVFSQTQIASGWGSAHGMPYSQQFWNKYRASYLDQNLHSNSSQSPAGGLTEASPQRLIESRSAVAQPVGSIRHIGYDSPVPVSSYNINRTDARSGKPVHIFPSK